MDIQNWKQLSLLERNEYLTLLIRPLGKGLFTVDESSLTSDYPRISQAIGEVVLNYRVIFHHQTGLGLSDDCYNRLLKINPQPSITLSEMKPFIKMEVNLFAVAEHPILEVEAYKIIGKPFSSNNTPAFFDYSGAVNFLNTIGARFLSEVEWEAGVKQGEDILFPFGNSLPDAGELDLWLSFDSQSFMKKATGNGLSGLFFGEWCGDLFKNSHHKNAEIKIGEYVIKGGGAYFWPWQADEWVWCLCAMRMPSGDLVDGTAVLRPALSLSFD
ncbi:hypothetical protein [Pelistega sp. MC2]|uniref:hypothetical protein n=1 Tax=Pelistega sp. MC2 TaxID=1720297 RepID=UPI0008DADF67|nr:hypothetical protein [Pelistega sp. MC2]